MKKQLLIIVFVASVGLLGSCLKGDDAQPIPVAGLTMVNSFIESPRVVYAMDGRVVQMQYGLQSLDYRSYGYVNLFIGNSRNLEVYASNSETPLVDTTFAVADSVFYSSFVYGTMDDPRHFLTEDRVPEETTDPRAIAAVRFFNLANTTHRVTLKIGDTDPVPAFGDRPTETSESGKAGEDFVEVPIGTYELTVEDEDGEIIATRTGSVDLEAGTYTTVFLTGAEDESGSYYVAVLKQAVN